MGAGATRRRAGAGRLVHHAGGREAHLRGGAGEGVGERRHAPDAGSLNDGAAAEAAFRWMNARPSSVILGKNRPALRSSQAMLSETLVSSKACRFEKPLRASSSPEASRSPTAAVVNFRAGVRQSGWRGERDRTGSLRSTPPPPHAG